MIPSRTYAGPRPLRCDDPQGQRIEMIAAGHIGVHASSRRIITGGAVMNTYRSPRKNHLAAKYIAISAITAAPAIQHMRTVSGFALPRNHSEKSPLLTSAPTVVATSSVARLTLAKASGREGV